MLCWNYCYTGADILLTEGVGEEGRGSCGIEEGGVCEREEVGSCVKEEDIHKYI